ncbi:hypothetical protein JCM8097_008173 [Rhodosporidiobolus ruineniae]
MRFSTAVALVALSATAAPVQAAPIFGLGQVISNILHTSQSQVQNLIDSWSSAVQQATDAAKHGKVTFWNPVAVVKKELSAIRHAHAVNWPRKKTFPGWKNYKANGVNIGAWLEIETNYVPTAIPSEYSEEWTYCETEGKAVCGPRLEKHYSSFVSTADIDKIAKYGINTLRIPTTYAAWYDVPGSQLYHGQQVAKLKNIAEYAIKKYNMHVVIGLHSLPGGVNWLQIGEAQGHLNWWYNSTNFDYSLKVVDKVLDYIEDSWNPSAYTLEAANEACDSFEHFATPETISYPDGVNYMNTYLRAVYALIEKRKMSTFLMFHDSFMGPSYWAPFWSDSDRIVIDAHLYFFAASGVYSQYTSQIACGQAPATATTVPVFVGEWSLQSYYNNTFALRTEIFQTQQYAWQNWLQGGAFWNIRYQGSDLVSSGEGGTKDYWSFLDLADAGVIPEGGKITGSYC